MGKVHQLNNSDNEVCSAVTETQRNGRPQEINSTCISVVLAFRKQGNALAQLVQALRYWPEGHGFDSR
jgi:hypothetical protein